MFASCNKVVVKRPYTFNEDYKSVNLADRKIILVYPSDDRIVVRNKDDVFDDFGGANTKPESRIRKFYFAEFFTTFKSLISGDSVLLSNARFTDSTWKALPKKEILLKPNTDSAEMRYEIPEKAALDSLGLDSAVFVVMQRIEFKRNNFHVEYYWDDKSRRPANLEVTMNLLLWDYKSNTPIFYGPLTERTEFQFGLQRKHWDESAHALAKKLISAARCL